MKEYGNPIFGGSIILDVERTHIEHTIEIIIGGKKCPKIVSLNILKKMMVWKCLYLPVLWYTNIY